MSADGDEEIPGREVAYRLFAAEYDDASLSHTESDEERAPNYVISPTGARINRLFVVGTLTEVTSVNEEMVRARVVDPTGAFVVYAGQYQPDELATLESIEPPAFVAVTGKARTFEPDDGDRIYTSVRPESIATVDADTRDRWVVSTAEQTSDRIGTYAGAAALEARGDELTASLEDADIDGGLAAGIPLAQDHYGTTPAYLDALRDCALETVAVVAGDRDQVRSLEIEPGDGGSESVTFESLADLPAVDIGGDAATDTAEPISTSATGETATADTADQSASADSLAADSSGVESTEPVDESADSVDKAGEAVDETADSVEGEDAAGTESTAASGGAEDLTAASSADDAVDEPDTEGTDDELDAEDADDELDADDFDDGMYEMDDEEREQLEAEFGTEFTTGSEVDEPGESDIDVPEPDDEVADGDTERDDSVSSDAEAADDLAEPPTSSLEADSEPALDDEPESSLDDTGEVEAVDSAGADEDDAEPTDGDAEEISADEDDAETTGDEPADDVDLQSYVVEAMDELDDGDGADRAELVETVVSDIDVPEADVEDAIQDALMGGQCYEPNDDKLKAI